MKIPTQDLCERLSHVEGMRRIGPLIAEARATIDAQAARIAELEAQLNAPRGTDEQIQKERTLTCEAIRGAMAFGYNGTNPPPRDNHWLAQFWEFGHKHAALEAQLRERGEPGVWETEQKGFTKNAAVAKWWRDAGLSVIEYYAHPPATAASEMTPDQREAIEWAAGEAYSHAKIASGGTLMYRRWVLLTDMFRAALTAKEKGE